jgi:hypothetical protein
MVMDTKRPFPQRRGKKSKEVESEEEPAELVPPQ